MCLLDSNSNFPFSQMKKAGASNSALGTPHALSPKVLYRAWTPAKNQKQYKMKGLKDSFADKKRPLFGMAGYA